MSNVFSLRTYKPKSFNIIEYRAYIAKQDVVELLEEMVNFQTERSQKGYLTTDLILKGRILFKALRENCETKELYNLANSYLNHLEFEFKKLNDKELA